RMTQITREYVDVQPGKTPAVRNIKYLDSNRTSNVLNIDARIGLYRDLELFAVFPIVLSDRNELDYTSGATAIADTPKGAGGLTQEPTGNVPLFQLPFTGAKRVGFGDMTLGLRYAPLQQWRDPLYPSLRIGVSWTIPTGDIKRAGNDAVGEGVHVLRFESTASRRIAFFEPYFGLFGNLKFPGSTTIFTDRGRTQNRVSPGHELGLLLGAEFFPWEKLRADGKKSQYLSLDVGFSAMYTFQGREYTELFEALGMSPCSFPDDRGLYPCQAGRYSPNMAPIHPDKPPTVYNRSYTDPPNAAQWSFMDGITDVSSYGRFSTWAGFTLQPIEYVQLSFRFTYSRVTSHFLSFANVGTDLDGLNGVDYDNTNKDANGKGQNEYNPVYNSEIDDPGRRFRSEGTNVFGVMLTLTGKY
ncbi:MAG: hypothetical protein FJ087_23515, partial [Deltaproteobacteria bacterium]|nr:hypothetical protein [Deltaproteobacteria bacterium]